MSWGQESMSFAGARCYSVCASFGMLLFVSAALGQTESTDKSLNSDTSLGSTATTSVATGLIDTDAIDRADECLVAQLCIDRYLWSLYERTHKIDTVRVPEQIKVAVKRRGKIRIVAKTVSKFVVEDFTWKDPKAAEKAGMSPMDYVIGGMEARFRVTLYHALHALEDAGLMPGITSAFR